MDGWVGWCFNGDIYRHEVSQCVDGRIYIYTRSTFLS